MNFDEFDACFDEFTSTVFRLEALQHYDVASDDEDFAAFRSGRPRPERSVRTSDWLRRVAVTTAAGKHWSRVHVVDHPLSEYLRYEMVAYIENAAAGEAIRIARREDNLTLLAELGPDFWLFDADTAAAFAVTMHYDRDGRLLGFDRVDDAATLDRYREIRDLTIRASEPINVYLATSHDNARGKVA